MKVGWILSGGRGVAGARIQGWNMHEYLQKQGIESEVLKGAANRSVNFSYTKDEIDTIATRKFDVILVQKVHTGDTFQYFVDACHSHGTKVIYIAIDHVNLDFALQCDAIMAVSTYIAEQIPHTYAGAVYEVFDGFEHNGEFVKEPTESNEITLVYTSNVVYAAFHQIAHLPEGVRLKIIGPPEERVKEYLPGTPLFTETPYDFQYVVWNLDTVVSEILACDVAVIPYADELLDQDAIKRKSSNRLLMFMSYGLPTIVSPHPAYLGIIRQGENGFVARTPDEWTKYIEYLRDNPDTRKEIGQNARTSVIDKYSLDRQGELYLKILKKVVG